MVETPTLAERVVTRLSGDSTITDIAADRVLDHDYRAEGWNAADVEIFGELGMMLPTIAVDEAGGDPIRVQKFRDGTLDRFNVWCFADRTRVGHRSVEQLTAAVRRRLHNWQDPTSKMLFRWDGRVGVVTAEDGCLDCVKFRVIGIPKR